MECPLGLLGKHFEKLIQCDPRLNFLSQQPDMVLDSPYFESKTAIDDQYVSTASLDRIGRGQAGLFELHDVESASAVQSSSSRSEHNLVGNAFENVSQEITSPPTSGTILVCMLVELHMFFFGATTLVIQFFYCQG